MHGCPLVCLSLWASSRGGAVAQASWSAPAAGRLRLSRGCWQGDTGGTAHRDASGGMAVATDAVPGGGPPVCALQLDMSTSEHASSARSRLTSAPVAWGGRARLLRTRASGGTAAKDESASSSAGFWGWCHRPEREPRRAWPVSWSPPTPTRHLYHLPTTWRPLDPPSEKHYPLAERRRCMGVARESGVAASAVGPCVALCEACGWSASVSAGGVGRIIIRYDTIRGFGLNEKVPMLRAGGHDARSCALLVTQHVACDVE